MKATKQISITLNCDVLTYIDELASLNDRTRSSMINWILNKEKQSDEALEKEAKLYEQI